MRLTGQSDSVVMSVDRSGNSTVHVDASDEDDGPDLEV